MKKTYLLLTALLLAFAVPLHADSTAPTPTERKAHVITIKNAFGWTDALEVDNAKPAEGFDSVSVDVTNCHGFGPLPDPLVLKYGQSKTYGDTGYGLNGSQCLSSGSQFDVTDLSVKNGDGSVASRVVYTYKATIDGKETNIRDVIKIPELPDVLVYPNCTAPAVCGASYEFSGAWNGVDGRSSYIAFVNVGDEGNVKVTAVNDATGVSTDEIVYLHKGDTFYGMTTKFPYGRVSIKVLPLNVGCGGCTPASFTPKIYAVLFRGYSGAGVAEAIVPRLQLSVAMP